MLPKEFRLTEAALAIEPALAAMLRNDMRKRVDG
jgi:hypothetical protein